MFAKYVEKKNYNMSDEMREHCDEMARCKKRKTIFHVVYNYLIIH